MATMKETRHELLKAKWKEIIREHYKSGVSIRKWCESHQISALSFFYWTRVIRQDLLIKAGTMAVTGQNQLSPRLGVHQVKKSCEPHTEKHPVLPGI